MRQRLCLHGIDIKHQAQLLGIVKKLMPACNITYKVKEKYFSDNDMYKCRVARLEPKGQQGYRVLCSWGVLVVSDRLLNIADVTVEFDARREQVLLAVESIVRSLLHGKQCFVLDEPDLSRRLDLLRGSYYLDRLELYAEGAAESALVCHVPWQLYSVNKLWEQLLTSEGAHKSLWRQLRVKLRRLRSVLALVKPLVPAGELKGWQGLLKARAQSLSSVRECDVLLSNCARLRAYEQYGADEAGTAKTKAKDVLVQQDLAASYALQQTHQQNAMQEQPAQATPQLVQLLESMRSIEQNKVRSTLKLNELTLELARLELFLRRESAAHGLTGKWATTSLKKFFAQRLAGWADKLLILPQGEPDVHDMEQLHRVRIKLKRFRYALQSVPELEASSQLLRSLKYLQDMLGLIHDDYVNEQHLQTLVEQHAELPELACEIALLRGWEQGRADAALQQLPRQWEEFKTLLTEWREGL